MNKSGLRVDSKDFDKKFAKITGRTIPESSAEGQEAAGEQWKKDADTISPKTPVKEGGLRASGKVSKTKIAGQETSVEISYDAPYARRLHEAEPGTIKFSEPGAGPKFLESKAVRFAKKYVGIVALTIRSKK